MSGVYVGAKVAYWTGGGIDTNAKVSQLNADGTVNLKELDDLPQFGEIFNVPLIYSMADRPETGQYCLFLPENDELEIDETSEEEDEDELNSTE